MSDPFSRRALLAGAAALFATGCTHVAPLSALPLGGEGRRLQIQLAGTGLHSWVLPEQVFVRSAGRLIPYLQLGRALKAGDRVVFVHRVIRDQPDGVKALIIAYDVLAVAGAITLAVVTFGSGIAVVSVMILDPSKPAWVGRRSEEASIVGSTSPATIRSDNGEVRFKGVDPGDLASFYRIDAEGPWVGPGTSVNVWNVDLWGPATQLSQINRAVVTWLRQTTTSRLHTALLSFLFQMERAPIGRSTVLVSPVEIAVQADRQSIFEGQRVHYRITARNTYGPQLPELAVALRLVPGLRLSRSSCRRDHEHGALDGEGGVWWLFRDVKVKERLVLRVEGEMDIASLE